MDPGQYGSSMYGPNTIPGQSPTAAVTYGQADPSRQELFLRNLMNERQEGYYEDKALQSIQNEEQKINSIEGGVKNTALALAPLVKGASTAGKTAAAGKAAAGAGKAAAGAGKGLLKGIGGMGAGAGIGAAGMLTSAIADDNDPTTTNVGENIGGALSGAGTGMMVGSLLGPAGTIVGGALGAGYGLIKNLLGRNKARRKMRRAEREEDAREARIAKQKGLMRLEALNNKTYGQGDLGQSMYMSGGPRQYYQTGGARRPGGVVENIPGSNAVEFKGRSHEAGGIHLDPYTEVEGGETMDDVAGKDYFFSDELQMDGKSFAERHKQILNSNDLTEEEKQDMIHKLAAAQEQMAGRDPSRVGDMKKKYQTGGFRNLSDFYNAYGQALPSLSDRSLMYSKAGGQGRYTGTSDQNRILLNALMQQEDAKLQRMTGKQEKSLFKVPEGITVPPKGPTRQGTMTSSSLPGGRGSVVYSNTKELVPDPQTAWNNAGTAQGPYLAPGYAPTQSPTTVQGSGTGEDMSEYFKYASRGIPTYAKIGALAQLPSSIYGIIKGQGRDDEELDRDDPRYTVGNVSSVRAPRLNRVNYDDARASATARSRGFSRSIDTAGMGAAGAVMKMSRMSDADRAMTEIDANEGRANTQIGNTEAQMAMQADSANASNRLRADMFDAQAYRTIDQLNASRKERNRDRVIAALDTLGSRIAGITGDALSYQSQERLARAIGSEGIYSRGNLREFFLGETDPETGEPYTERRANEMARKVWKQVQGDD